MNNTRKAKSEEILKLKNIPFIEHLPAIVSDEDAKIRSKEEIVKRAIALQMVAVKSEGTEEEIMKKIISDFKAEEFFTPIEKKFIEKENPTESEKVYFDWQYECYWVMLWVLSYVDTLDYPDHVCDVQKAVGIMKEAGNYENFIEKAKVREISEILDEADLIYRYDWACVNARVKGEEVPGKLNPEVVVERHRALNWLINYMDQNWDDIKPNT